MLLIPANIFKLINSFQDKPKFGGKGTKKQTCVERKCHMRGVLRRMTGAF